MSGPVLPHMRRASRLARMYRHEPNGYACPFCKIAAGEIDEACVVARTDDVFAVMALHQTPANYGNILVIPIAHVENIYDFPLSQTEPLMRMVKAVALGLKEKTGCHGISIRQHNEPAGSQDVWHLHMHVTPRYKDDLFYTPLKVGDVVPATSRAEFVARLKDAVAKHLA